MVHKIVTCDWCGEIENSNTPGKKMEVMKKIHDFCQKCVTLFEEKLAGTGTVNATDLTGYTTGVQYQYQYPQTAGIASATTSGPVQDVQTFTLSGNNYSFPAGTAFTTVTVVPSQ